MTTRNYRVRENRSGMGRTWQVRAFLCLAAGSWLACGCSSPRTTFEPIGVQAGAVVCEDPLATRVGLDILERGGNAADAAVAVSFALAVVYPRAGNLGGGGFALISRRGQDPAALDFREVAPASVRVQMYLDDKGQFVGERSVRGPLSVGVPGSPAGLYALHKEYGSGNLSWAQVLKPAIRLARDGFPVDAHFARDLQKESVKQKFNRAALGVFYPGGKTPVEGDLFVQADLAETLGLLAKEGPRAFYGGPLGAAMLRALSQEPVPGLGAVDTGVVDQGDLDAYKVRWMKPLVGSFRGMELITMPPPSSGGVVLLQALAVLEGLPQMKEVRVGREDDLEGLVSENLVHWWIEVLRHAFADRAEHLGDPAYHDVPTRELLDTRLILARRSSIGTRANLEVAPWAPDVPPESLETTHISVVDSSGAAVSMTTTLNGSYGSGIMVQGAGFLLNNELDDFSIQAGMPNQFGLVGSRANAIEPGKRPLSSMSPVIVRDHDGSLRMVLGSPGGPRIITSVFQVLLRVLLLEQSLPDAVAAARFHQQWRPATTLFEQYQGGGWDPKLLRRLQARGHPVQFIDQRMGSVQAILIGTDGWPVAYSDPRRGGAGGVEGQGVALPARP